MKTTIYLARHGVTMANKENRFAGRSDEPLHDEGRDQVAEVGHALATKSITAIYCGPLPRTRQSAEIIGRILPAPVKVCEGINEIFLPHWDNLTKEEIREQFGREYPTWLSDPAGFKVAGCEAIADVQQRAVNCIETIFTDNCGENILVITHLIVVRALLLYYQDKPIDDFRSIKVSNAQVAVLSRDDDGLVGVEY